VKEPARLRAEGTARAAVRPAPGTFSRSVVEAAGKLEVGDEALMLAREVAMLVPAEAAEERSAFALLVLASLVNLSHGSTRLPLAAAQEGLLARLLAELGAAPEERVGALELAARLGQRQGLEAWAPVIGEGDAYRPLLVQGACLYHQRTHALEARVAAALAARLCGPAADAHKVRQALDDTLRAPPEVGGKAVRPSDEQRAAVVSALTAPLTVISGGPGTGKTAVVVTILRTLVRAGGVDVGEVALAAPTGKATDRMRQSIAASLRQVREPALVDRELLRAPPAAVTLHRLLGYSPRSGRFRHHRNNPLAARLVIVDESSMIDLALMDRLLGALAPEARLVLLGDAHQLPSVEAGAVFRDLCRVGSERAVELTRSYRMDPSDPAGRNVLSLAQRMNAGDAEGLTAPGPASAGARSEVLALRGVTEVAFEGVELVEAVGLRARDGVLERWEAHARASMGEVAGLEDREHGTEGGQLDARGAADVAKVFAHQERFRVLCLTHGRTTGVESVNAWFHARAAARQGVAVRERELLAGEPVIVLRNDYERRLFNGDPGLVVRTTGGMAVAFRRDDGFVLFPLGSVRSAVEMAWAVTVHKAQGSEHDHVAVVLPETDTPLLHRELLYTAVTRSRRSALLVGPRAMLEVGVRRALVRESGVADRVREALAQGAAPSSPSGA
jgi:exodeoxyribonuclease V alpha subunit